MCQASSVGNLQMVECLLKYKANVNQENKVKTTIFGIITKFKHAYMYIGYMKLTTCMIKQFDNSYTLHGVEDCQRRAQTSNV